MPGQEGTDGSAAELVEVVGQRLLGAVERTSIEELRGQDARFDRDSRFGRELLFLIANTEWIRNTAENVTVAGARSLETTLEVHVDLDEIVHEAFWEKDRVWLPVLVIPGGRGTAPQAFPAITVTDAGGALRSTLPQAVARRQVAAALAEIIINMAVARWPMTFGPDARLPASREQRLVLSAAVLRVLQGERDEPPTGPAPRAPADIPAGDDGVGPLLRAKEHVKQLLTGYLGVHRAMHRHAAGEAWAEWAEVSTGELVERTARVLAGLTGAVFVVVGTDRSETDGVLTVHVPPRRLELSGRWRRWRRHGVLTLDVLAPSAQTPRDLKVLLPPGLSSAGSPVAVDIVVQRPEPLQQLESLLRQVLADGVPPAVALCLADLAAVKVPVVRELFRSHQLVPAGPDRAGGRAVDELLGELAGALARFRTAVEGGGHGRTELEQLTDLWTGGSWLAGTLARRTSDQTLSAREVHVHADAVTQPGLRPAPLSAVARIPLLVSDSPLFSAARYTGWMSLVLLGAVLALLLTGRRFDDQVLAGTLTIFSAILATRVEYPDRSTLLGSLSTAGYWLIVASILPTVLLAVALAFADGHRVAVASALIAFGVQVAVVAAMRLGPLSGRRPPAWTRSRGLRLRTAPEPDHARIVSLQSSWWRTTTAEALRLGREAHAFVVRQGSGPGSDGLPASEPDWWRAPLAAPDKRSPRGTLGSVLSAVSAITSREPAPAAAGGPPASREAANILSLVRAGTTAESVTFFVFREEPGARWLKDHDVVLRVPLRPDRLAPAEAPADVVHVFVGTPADGDRAGVGDHPLTRMMRASATFRLGLSDVQLPVPPPAGGQAGLSWSRVQIALHPGDTGGLGAYLTEIAARFGPDPRTALVVQAGLEQRSRVITTVPGAQPGPPGRPRLEDGRLLVLADDLDVLAGAADTPGADWLLLALTATARPNLDTDVLDWLGTHRPGLALAGLTSATLHGTSVVFLLAHGPDAADDDPDGSPDLAAELRAAFTGDGLRASAEWRTAAELGTPPGPGGGPVLRVHLRSRDRPGLVAQLMFSLRRVLSEMTRDEGDTAGTGPERRPERRLDPWYVLLQVVERGTARARLTVRLPPELEVLRTWDLERWETAEQSIRRVLSGTLGPEPSPATAGWGNLDSTVINLELVAYRPEV